MLEKTLMVLILYAIWGGLFVAMASTPGAVVWSGSRPRGWQWLFMGVLWLPLAVAWLWNSWRR